jgi:hypothetical protein
MFSAFDMSLSTVIARNLLLLAAIVNETASSGITMLPV